MLWYKAWRESRTRFLLSALVLAILCLVVVLFQEQIRAHKPLLPGFKVVSYSEHIYKFIYSGMAKAFYVFILLFLGLGGLRQEQAHGTAAFTLALPVSRLRLVAVRIGMGITQMAVLALLPALIIPTVSLTVHQSYPLTEALHFSVLWVICGAVLYAMVFLFSTVLSSAYTALAVSYIAFFLQDAILSSQPLMPYRLKLLHILGEFGTMKWNVEHTVLSSGPMPWVHLAAFSLVAACMLSAAVHIAQKQDF
jgi:ABC-type transport system involved in multi-copper enzyme maturation permease subunit